MQTLTLNDAYQLSVGEMSRRAQLEISTWFNGWLAGGGSQLEKLRFLSAISTQLILNSRITLYHHGEKQPAGTYELEDGVQLVLPLTEACLNELPASVVGWMIDAAGKENAFILDTFLAGTRVLQTHARMRRARLSASGPVSKLGER